MTTTFEDALAQARHLNVADRIRLAQVLWDEVEESTEQLQLPKALLDELDRRIERHELHPEEASPWAEVRARIEGRS